MIQCKSSNIRSIDFEASPDDPSIGQMTVEFVNGRRYVYDDVETPNYEALEREAGSVVPGASVGKLFNRIIRNGGYSVGEVTDAV